MATGLTTMLSQFEKKRATEHLCSLLCHKYYKMLMLTFSYFLVEMDLTFFLDVKKKILFNFFFLNKLYCVFEEVNDVPRLLKRDWIMQSSFMTNIFQFLEWAPLYIAYKSSEVSQKGCCSSLRLALREMGQWVSPVALKTGVVFFHLQLYKIVFG